MRSKLTLETLTSNSGQNYVLYVEFFKIDLILQKRLANLYEHQTLRQKMMFWLPFWHFFIRRSVSTRPPYLPASDQFCCHFRPPERGRSPAGLWSAVRCGVSQHSNQFLVSGHLECGGRRVLSRAGLSLFLSVIHNVATPLWKILKPQRSITHLPDTGKGEFTPRESEVKTERTLVVKELPGPRLN